MFLLWFQVLVSAPQTQEPECCQRSRTIRTQLAQAGMIRSLHRSEPRQQTARRAGESDAPGDGRAPFRAITGHE